MNLSKVALEQLELMQNQEIWSIRYETCIVVKGNKVIGENQKVLATLNTSKKINDLFKELYDSEIGLSDSEFAEIKKEVLGE